jgi:hypothetical protein
LIQVEELQDLLFEPASDEAVHLSPMPSSSGISLNAALLG